MKCFTLFVLLLAATIGMPYRATAQSAEIQQLILNIQKLAQLRSILSNMYKGYTIITKGYNTIKDISSGNFKMHQLFLDGLMEVNPKVRKYYRIAEIIALQQTLIKEYRQAASTFKKINVFRQTDLAYIESVHQQLAQGSLDNLEELIMITTAGKLRMSDAERLEGIDRIHLQMTDRLSFLRHFNDKSRLLAAQRASLLQDNEFLQKIYGHE